MSMHAVLGSLLVLTFAATMPAQTTGFTFTIETEKVALPVVAESGAPSEPRAGDLVVFQHRLWLRLDEPGDYEFTDRWVRGSIERNGIGIAASDERLLGLDEPAKRALRGVRLTAWNERIAAAVQALPADVPLTLTHGAAIDGRLPQLPSATKYLWVQADARPFDLAHGAALRELRALRVDGLSRSPLDLAPFAETRQLRWLELHDVTLQDGGSLLRFPHLRAFVTDLVDVDASWLAMAKDLRRFEVRNGDVRSLEALAALPNLEEIVIDRRGIGTRRRADGTPSVQLPTNDFPKLRRLELRNTDVSVDAARAFRDGNPECRIFGVPLPEQHFTKALASANRVVVDGRFEQPRFETEDAATVREVAASFASLIADEPRPQARPEAVLEFFAGTERLVRFEIHGAFASVTDGRWPGDFRLADDECRALRRWLRSITAPARK